MAFGLMSARLLGDHRDAREQRVLNELDQTFDHFRLAGKVAIQGGLRQTHLLGEFGGGDLPPGLDSSMRASACSISGLRLALGMV